MSFPRTARSLDTPIAPAPSTTGGGSGGRGQKRKAIDELNGLFTDTQLDEWLHEVGGSDAMLDGLLGL